MMTLHEELGKILSSVEKSTPIADFHQEGDVATHITEDVTVDYSGDERYDHIDHWVISTVSEHKCRQRCKNCQHHTYYYCQKCQKHLCFTSNKNCFREYHHRHDDNVIHAAIGEVRYDKCGHWPLHWDGVHAYRQRCANCGSHTNCYCEKCRIHLCLTLNRNCFKDYHSECWIGNSYAWLKSVFHMIHHTLPNTVIVFKNIYRIKIAVINS